MSQRKTADEILNRYNVVPRDKAISAIQEYAKQEVEARDELIKEMKDALSIVCDFPVEDIEYYREKGVTMTINSLQYSIIHKALTKAQSFNQE